MIGKTKSHLPREIINSKSHSFLRKVDYLIFKNIIILLSHGVNKIIEKLGEGGIGEVYLAYTITTREFHARARSSTHLVSSGKPAFDDHSPFLLPHPEQKQHAGNK